MCSRFKVNFSVLFFIFSVTLTTSAGLILLEPWLSHDILSLQEEKT